MGKNTKKNTSSKKSVKTSDKATKDALAITTANIARIEAAERGETPPSPEKEPVSAKVAKSKAPAKTKAPKPKKERRVSLLDHAVAVLKKAGKAMTCQDIVNQVLASGQWKTDGKTPAATLYSAVIREIAAKGKAGGARFTKTERGQFAAAKGA